MKRLGGLKTGKEVGHPITKPGARRKNGRMGKAEHLRTSKPWLPIHVLSDCGKAWGVELLDKPGIGGLRIAF